MAGLVGRTVGKYRIVARLGRGGMAEVYKAYQPGLDRYVGIKVLHTHLVDDTDFIRRFEREARAVGRLRHPHIVQTLDFDHEGDLFFMAMEFIDGPTLKYELKARRAENKPFTLKEIARIFTALCSAIDYAHSHGMVHRDLKPANIMINQEGQVVLADFGVAQIIGATQYTQTGALSGTPAYMSPEQGQGEPGDERSDIYSLGIMLYELVTDVVPYDADTPFAVIMKHISEPLPLPTELKPDVPESVERVILKAMSKNPEDRYQTAGEMARTLREAVDLSPDEESLPLVTVASKTKIEEIDHSTDPLVPLVLKTGQTGATVVSLPDATTGTLATPAKESIYQRTLEFLRRNLTSLTGAGRKRQGSPAQADNLGAEEGVSELRVDAAVPDKVELGRVFELAVAVRQLASAVLAEDDLPKVRSGYIQVSQSKSRPYISLRVQVSAPDCEIHGQDHHAFRLYSGQDSPVFHFQLTPKIQGRISLIVTVLQEDDWLGSARVHTIAYEQIAGEIHIDVASQPILPKPANKIESLHRQLAQRSSNLLKLQEQAAMFGAGEVPLHLLNQIEAEQEAIAEIEANLADMGSN